MEGVPLLHDSPLSAFEVHSRTVGPFGENTYLLVCAVSRQAVVIDPGDVDPVLELIDAAGCQVEAIWATHAHLDHVVGVAELKRSLEVPFHLHPGEAAMLAGLPAQAAMFGLPAPEVPEVDGELAAGRSLALGELSVGVAFTPGHSPGHVSFLLPGAVISGDCLFAGSIGRTDLPGGDHDTLLASIRDVLLVLPDETVVYPGHMEQTTIGRERASNPFLR